MFLYIDHLFAEGREREVKPLHSIPDTLSELYLLAMREHRRKAVLRFQDSGEWADVPDWRFDRQTIRLALYLEEHGLLDPGDRVALIAPLRPEWPSIDLSAVCAGAVSVSLPSDASREALASALATERPRVAYVDADVYPRIRSVLDLFEETETVIVIGETELENDAVPFKTALDLGGTHDTPENAQRFRARAREAAGNAVAFRHYRSDDDALVPLEFTHERILEELKSLWLRAPAEEGDRVYVAPGEVSLSTRLALYAHIGDGYSTLYLGSPAREPAQIAELAPQVIIAPAEALQATIERSRGADVHAGDDEDGDSDSKGWLARLTRRRRSTRERNPIREALGGRVRCISPTTPPDPNLSALLDSAVSLPEASAQAAAPHR